MNAKGAAASWLTAGVAYMTLEAIAAAAVPGYRYADDFISDLGRPESPLSFLMNGAFVVQGTLFCLGAALLVRRVGLFTGFAAANAIGNVVVAVVHSGASGVAWVHVTGAVIAIVGGNAAIVTGASAVEGRRYYRLASKALAALGFTAFLLLVLGAVTATTVFLPAAVWERTSVYTIIGWQVLSSIELLARRR